MNENLKPCPFCGVPYPYITFERGYIDDSAVVFCNACKMSVKLEENDQKGFNDVTKEKAIEAWNRRAKMTIENVKITNTSIQPEQKIGRWIEDCGDLYCSVCGFRNSDHYCLGKGIACPNCGAFMPDGLKNVLG